MDPLKEYEQVLNKLDAADATGIAEEFGRRTRCLESDLKQRGMLRSVAHLTALVKCEVEKAKRRAQAKLNNALELMRAKNLPFNEENARYLEEHILSPIEALKRAEGTYSFDAKRELGLAYSQVMGNRALQLDSVSQEIRAKMLRLKEIGISRGFSDEAVLSKVFKSIYEIDHAVKANLFELDLSDVSELVDPNNDFERKVDILALFLKRIDTSVLANITPITSRRRREHIGFLSDWLTSKGEDPSSIEEVFDGILTIRNFQQHRGEQRDKSEQEYLSKIVPNWFGGDRLLPDNEKWQIVISKFSLVLSDLLEVLRKFTP